MDITAFALSPNYTLDEDGDVPRFTGGVLYAGNGDIDLGAELHAGEGLIVVNPQRDSGLCEVLRAHPALTEVDPADVPSGRDPLSPYERQTLEALQTAASVRQLVQADTTSHARLVAALQEDDKAQDDALATAQEVYDSLPEHKLDPLIKPQLIRLAALRGNQPQISMSQSKTVIIATLISAGITDPAQVPDPFEDLDEDELEALATEHNVEVTDDQDENDIIAALVIAGVTPDQEA